MDSLDSMWPEQDLWKASDSSILNLVAHELSPQQVVPSSSPERAPESSCFSPELLGVCQQDLFQPLFLDTIGELAQAASPACSPESAVSKAPSPPRTRSKANAALGVDTKPAKKIAKAATGAKRKRKRAKHVPTAVLISSVQLKTMTCEQIDTMAAEIEKQRPLTAEEEADFKSYKRRIMNRESAKESRQKKQELIKDISDALQESKEHNERLQRRIRELEEENSKLRMGGVCPPVHVPAPVDLLDEVMSDCSSPSSGSEEGSPASPSSFWSLGQASLPGKAGVCLFVVLLSFGLMFTAIQPGDFNNHSQLSALAPLMLQQSTGRAITNEPFVSSSQMEKLAAIASSGSRGSMIDAGVHYSRDLLHYEPLSSTDFQGFNAAPATRTTAKYHEAEEAFDVHQAANSTSDGFEVAESYDMDLSVDSSSVNVVFSSSATGRTELELDLHYIEVPHDAHPAKEHAVAGHANLRTDGHSIFC